MARQGVAWLHRTVAPTIAAIFAPGADHEMPLELAMGAVDNPFAIPNFRVENPEAAAHTRVGWFRSVSNIPDAFAIQVSWRSWRRPWDAIPRTICWS